MIAEKSLVSPYRWIVLAGAWCSLFVLTMAWYVMPTLEHELLSLYGMSRAQYSTALTFPFLVAGLMGVAGGMAADRLGIRKAASLGVFLAGIGVITRGMVSSYPSLLLAMMFIGLGLGLLMPNLPKLVSLWFPSHETGLATGIYNTALMGGISTGLVIAPLLPGWSRGNLLLGAIVLTVGLLFFLVVKDAPPGKKLRSAPLLEGIGKALKSKSAWGASLAVGLALAGMVSFQGALPGGLHGIYHIPMSTGGGIASLISYAGILGSLTLPPMATRLNKRRAFMILLPIAFSIIMVCAWLFGNSPIVLWTGTALAGYLAGGSLPLIMEVITYLPRLKHDPVEHQHVGGASGMVVSFMNLGGFSGLPFIVMPVIMHFGYTWGFLVAAILFASQALFPAIGIIEVPDFQNAKEEE